MARGVNLDLSAIRRCVARVNAVKKTALKAQRLARVGVVRGLRPEAARVISSVQLNLPPRQIARYLTAHLNDDTVSLSASRDRLPLMDFRPAIGRDGVRVMTFRSRGVQHLPHAFLHKGKIKQRIPAKGRNFDSGPSGLVWRLPIVNRAGPSLARTLRPDGRHGADPMAGEVVKRLAVFARATLARELGRLLGRGV